MNGPVEDMLREGLDRLTADVQVPEGVTGRARAHLRRKKMAVRAALAGGAAAVTAVAVVAAVVPGQVAPRPVQARTAAYVITRVANALAGPLGFLDGAAGHPRGEAAHAVTAALRPGMTLAGGRP